jgi:hypothetical protein
MTTRNRFVLSCLASLLFLAACMSPTDPDTPRRRITDPTPYFLRTIDMSEYDEGYDVNELEDGGFIIVGRTWMRHTGSKDVLLVRTDAEGQTTWIKTFGGVYTDEGYAVKQTSDGGFVLTGITESYTNGNSDVWLVKTDAGGNMLWSKSFGSTGIDCGLDVIECRTGGYLVAGYGQPDFAGKLYALLIRTDELGSEIWTKRYGRSERDLATSVIEVEDGGFVVTGSTETGGNGSTVLWLFKVNATGDRSWEQLIDGGSSKGAFRLARSGSGAFGIVGYEKTQQSEASDMLFVRTDASGDMLREVVIEKNALGTGVAATPDGGFVLCGYTDPMGSDGSDIVFVKVDMDGNEQWKRVIGGNRMDRARSVCALRNGGYVLTGTTQSYGSGNQDLLIIKTDPSGTFEE